MGFRLPLDSLPWVAKTDFPTVYERHPLEPLGPLPSYGPEADGSEPGGWDNNGHSGSNGSAALRVGRC